MNRSIHSSMVTMRSIQQAMDVVANNIANIDRTGYKRQAVSFADVLTQVTMQPQVAQNDGRWTPLGWTERGGALLDRILSDFSQGPLTETKMPLDIAISGQAVIEVRGAQDGTPSWVRGGAWQLSPIPGNDGLTLTTANGDMIQSIDDEPIVIPNNRSIQIDERGVVYALGGIDGLPEPIATLKVMTVQRPDALVRTTDDRWMLAGEETAATVLAPYEPVAGQPAVAVLQGMLERSNVALSQEMSELLLMQRTYQLNARALTSADVLLGMANNLRGG